MPDWRRSWAAERCGNSILRAVLPQQPVDGLDVVVDLLDGTAASLRLPGHGSQVLARLDQREGSSDGVDITALISESFALTTNSSESLRLSASTATCLLTQEAKCNDAQRRSGCYTLSCFLGSNSLRVYGLVCLQACKYMHKNKILYGFFTKTEFPGSETTGHNPRLQPVIS